MTRMQVLVEASELRRLQRIARSKGKTLAAWVREVLREAAREEPEGDAARKLRSLRAAASNEFPAPDIEEMLADIERGYTAPLRS